jgi:hypothetical protein
MSRSDPPVRPASLSRLETVFRAVFGDEFLQSVDVALFLLFEFAPEILQIDVTFGVGDILVSPPERIEPFAEFVDHVVIVVGCAMGFPDVSHLFFRGEAHDEIPLLSGFAYCLWVDDAKVTEAKH